MRKLTKDGVNMQDFFDTKNYTGDSKFEILRNTNKLQLGKMQNWFKSNIMLLTLPVCEGKENHNNKDLFENQIISITKQQK